MCVKQSRQVAHLFVRTYRFVLRKVVLKRDPEMTYKLRWTISIQYGVSYSHIHADRLLSNVFQDLTIQFLCCEPSVQVAIHVIWCMILLTEYRLLF